MTNRIVKALEDGAEKLGKALAEDAGKAVSKLYQETGANLRKVAKNTAEVEEKHAAELKKILEDGKTDARPVALSGKGHAPGHGASPAGPPWPVVDGVAGAARGKSLNPPHRRHTLAGVKGGQVKAENSVILRGYEKDVHDDVAQIAAGRAHWNAQTQRYEINGRSYGVEPHGTVFPDSGVGIVNMDRNEYAALKELAKADGDPSKVPAFTRDPRFRDNPHVITKAHAVYHGKHK
ncbi:hypothetical protein [Kitasatospora cheerisanensis]|uniref:Uncharacterized protein n=1 Tax=Kitasatospora cheerisanensis KCTC 2395 TaxID=1348663 RepID=A0A066Z295_9ACTN|nr:hypothetical protein [Kitasatospora cheerisanensis]KDN84275.1 hypothetical protein KCH_40660 [Kitasatospora cheerisanensis KCTC 2395]